jgi:hypothetical protein
MEREAVLSANETFYRAFAGRDIDAMERLWSHAEPVACIHPGWGPIVGRGPVMASWRAILGSSDAPAIACRRPQAFLRGDSAFVICFEEVGGGMLVATNLFARDKDGWKMTHHQAGPAPAFDETPPPPTAAIH